MLEVGVGFEPTDGITACGFRDRRIQPDSANLPTGNKVTVTLFPA